MKKITIFLCVIILVYGMLFSACVASEIQIDEEKSESSNVISNEKTSNEETNNVNGEHSIDTSMKTDDLSAIEVEYTDSDKKTDYDESDAVNIELNDEGSVISGQGAVIEGKKVIINQAGTYILSGILTNGQILVEATKVDDVTLVFDGVDITNKTGSAVCVLQAEKVFILLNEGSENIIRDGDDYKDDKDDDPDAALFSEDDLTIKGTGSLVIQGNFNHGVHVKDELVITGGILDVSAKTDGIKGKDSVSILDGDINIVCSSDGIISNKEDDEEKGFVSIDGGNINIEAGENGVQGQVGVLITQGNININAGGDTVHSNGSILINGGVMTLFADDDGMHADNALDIIGGVISIENSYEGLEGAYITIGGGDITVVAQDDGINAAGGSDGDTKIKDRFSSAGNYFILINGGSLSVEAGNGDGIDSNGTIEIAGGNIQVIGSQSPMEPVLDTNGGEVVYNGGTFIAGTNTTMLSLPTTATQTMVAIIFDEPSSSYMDIALKNSDGNVMLKGDYSYTYPCAILASHELVSGQQYTVEFGDGSHLEFIATGGLMTINEKGEDIEFTYEMPNKGGMRGGGFKK